MSSSRINFAVAEQGLYFIALEDTDFKASVGFSDYATRKRSTLVHLNKPFWFGTTLTPDGRSLVDCTCEI